MKVVGPNGQKFFIGKDGRKVDEDGFKCASPTPGQRGPWFCVAVKISADKVEVRDTKDAKKSTLTFKREEWKAFIEGVRKGEFDIS